MPKCSQVLVCFFLSQSLSFLTGIFVCVSGCVCVHSRSRLKLILLLIKARCIGPRALVVCWWWRGTLPKQQHQLQESPCLCWLFLLLVLSLLADSVPDSSSVLHSGNLSASATQPQSKLQQPTERPLPLLALPLPLLILFLLFHLDRRRTEKKERKGPKQLQ